MVAQVAEEDPAEEKWPTLVRGFLAMVLGSGSYEVGRVCLRV